MESEVAMVLEPVLLAAPPMREIGGTTEVEGVEKVKLLEVAGPAVFVEITAYSYTIPGVKPVKLTE